MRYRLRTLVLVTIFAPPLLWSLYIIFQPAGRLYWFSIFVVSLIICAPMAAFRLHMIRLK